MYKRDLLETLSYGLKIHLYFSRENRLTQFCFFLSQELLPSQPDKKKIKIFQQQNPTARTLISLRCDLKYHISYDYLA